MQDLINDYLKRINNLYFNEDKWIYVHIQSLFEKLSIKILKINELEAQNYNTIKLLKEYKYRHYHIEELETSILICNQFANKIKHYSEDIVNFDSNFTDKLIIQLDDFLYGLYFKHLILDLYKRKYECSNLGSFDIYIPFYGDYASTGFILKFKDINMYNDIFNNDTLLAIVYGIITRSSKLNKNIYVKEYENRENVNVDLLKLKNNEILMLFLFKYGILSKNKNKVYINENSKYEFILAFEEVKRYLINILQLMKKEYDFLQFDLELTNNVSFNLNEFVEMEMIDSNDGLSPYIWDYGETRYNIKNEDKKILLDFLEEFFNFSVFKPGQYESIVSMLNLNENSLSILPTGQGKSLIYFYISLLLPGPSIIISPTNILIEDQIRNLDDFNIDNVYGVLDETYIDVDIFKYKMLYLTSYNFLNSKIYKFLNKANKRKRFSQIVIDEVHTICQWSHDFRPEYLMLTKFLNVDFNGNICRCFTATATYKVIKDISKNLNIEISKIITLNKKINECFSFDFTYIDEGNLINKLTDKLSKLINKDNKSMIFLYDKLVKEFIDKLPEKLQINSNYISTNGTFHYDEFVKGEKKLLFSNGDLGIGINLPEIKNILHCYMPKSLPQYIQEIGRSSRDEFDANSIVFLRKLTEEEEYIFGMINSNQIINVKQLNSSDFVYELIKHVTKGADMKTSINQTISLWWELYDGKTLLPLNTNPFYLYVLSLFDFVTKWHYEKDCIIVYPNITRNVAKANFKLREFFKENNCFNTYEYQLNEAGTANRLIDIYYNWWFKNYIRFHINQYVESYNFFSRQTSNQDKIDELNKLLSVSLLEIDEIISKDDLTFSKITNYTLENIEKLEPTIREANLYEPNIKYDYFYLLRDLYHGKVNDLYLKNIMTTKNLNDIQSFKNNIQKVYFKLKDDTKYELINSMTKYKKLNEVISYFYNDENNKDSVYYSYYIKILNSLW